MAITSNPLGQQGVLQVVPPAALEAWHPAASRRRSLRQMAPQEPAAPELVGYIKTQFEIFRNHRNTAAGWSNRLIEALRAFNGQYSAHQDAGGDEVRRVASLCPPDRAEV